MIFCIRILKYTILCENSQKVCEIVIICLKNLLFSKKVRQKVRQAVGLAEHVVSVNILFV